MMGCTFDTSASGGNKDSGGRDRDAMSDRDRDAMNDATNVDPVTDASNVDAPTNPDDNLHLLLSEVKTLSAGFEFIEIYNPTSSEISLDDYYLADYGQYFQLPAVGAGPQSYTPDSSDFVARFPAGHTIASKGVVVVGIRLIENSDIIAQFHIGKPDGATGSEMNEAYAGSIGSTPTLTDAGESVILFYWDGTSNLVQDVDIVIAGNNPSDINLPPDKDGITVIGPAGQGNGPDTYQRDSLTLPDMSAQLNGGQSYTRTALEGDNEDYPEMNRRGNGLFGHDETSEETNNTWAIRDFTPGTTTLSEL